MSYKLQRLNNLNLSYDYIPFLMILTIAYTKELRQYKITTQNLIVK